MPHKSLRELDVGLTEKGIRIIEEFPELEVVKLGGQATTDRSIEILCRCNQLKRLEMNSPKFGDDGWKLLAKLPKLKSVIIRLFRDDRVPFSAKAVAKFLDQRPDCNVYVSRGKLIDNDEIRELAKTGNPWPRYEYWK